MSFDYLLQNDEKSIIDLETKLRNKHARKMGHFENFFAIFQRLKTYKTFSVIVSYDSKINDPFLLFNSIKPILLKNPLLLTTIVVNDVPDSIVPRPHDYIKIVNELKFKDLFIADHEEKVKDLEIDVELFAKLNNISLSYGQNELTWKLAILNDYTLAFISNHVLIDGITAKNFFQDLECELNKVDITTTTTTNKPLINDDSIIFQYSKDFKNLGNLPPSSEDIIIPGKKNSYWSIPEFFINQFIYKTFCFNTPSSPNDKINYHYLHISAKQLSKIKKHLISNEKSSMNHDRKFTLTPYIQTAWLNAQEKTEIYPLSTTNFFTNFVIAVDSRQYISEITDDDGDNTQDLIKYGLNVGAFSKFYSPVTKFTWNWVDYFNKHLKSSLNTQKSLIPIGLLSWNQFTKNSNMDKLMKKWFKTQTRTNTFFSNLGMVDSRVGLSFKYQIEDVIFTQNLNGYHYDFTINCASTAQGGLKFVITSPNETSFGYKKFRKCCDAFYDNLVSECIE